MLCAARARAGHPDYGPPVPAHSLHSAGVNLRDPYTPHVPPAAIAYQRSGYLLAFFAMFEQLLGLWLLLRTGLSARLSAAVYRALRLSPQLDKPPPFWAIALFFAVISFLMMLWMLPSGLAGLALEHRYGFARQTVFGYLGDALLDTLFGLVMIPVLWGGYRLYARAPRRWWQWLWLLLIPLMFLQLIAGPVVIAPAFNRFTPLPPGKLRDDILALAAKAGITGARVFVSDTSRRTSHVNAYVTGLGPTTRIVLNDTALRTLPEDQILAMVGHEMGHYVEGHIWVKFMAGVMGSGVFLWLAARLLPYAARRWGRQWRLQSITDLAALPLVMLVLALFLIVQAPIENGLSRALEHRADAFGLRITHLNDAMARLFVGFAERDYSDPDPPAFIQFWFGSHPPLRERIAFALHR